MSAIRKPGIKVEQMATKRNTRGGDDPEPGPGALVAPRA